MDATPSVAPPDDAPSGLPGTPRPTRIGSRTFSWGSRTYLMGIINVTPDSFSGDGLLGGRSTDSAATAADPGESGGPAGEPAGPVPRAVDQARRMAAEGADLLDIGGESSRPGHAEVTLEEERQRVLPVVRAIREALPGVPISIDTIKREVAEAALDAGADLINDVWGTGPADDLARLAGERGVPYVLMHNREEARYGNLVAEVMADLQRAIERALAIGVAWDALIVDPGFGFGKTPEHNLALFHDLHLLRALGRPVLLGISRKSTIGKVLDLPADQRLEGTLASTALGIAAGVDIVRVHDVEPNLRAARMADAIVRRRGSFV